MIEAYENRVYKFKSHLNTYTQNIGEINEHYFRAYNRIIDRRTFICVVRRPDVAFGVSHKKEECRNKGYS